MPPLPEGSFNCASGECHVEREKRREYPEAKDAPLRCHHAKSASSTCSNLPKNLCQP
jgi:hypothetical protein